MTPVIEVFNADQCQEIVSCFDSADLVPDDYGFSPNSFGISNLRAANFYSLLLTEKVFEQDPALCNRRLVFKHSYARKYLPGSRLKLHIDRPGLDYTISVCLETPENFHWPLKISNAEWFHGDWTDNLNDYSQWLNNHSEFNLSAGQGVFAKGRSYPHWRETFPECQVTSDTSKELRAVYVFYHWEVI